MESAGAVLFTDTRGGGTEIRVELQYNPPSGFAGAYGAKLFGRDAQSEIETDCQRLKQYLEAGEVATVEGQPRGPSSKELSERRRERK